MNNMSWADSNLGRTLRCTTRPHSALVCAMPTMHPTQDLGGSIGHHPATSSSGRISSVQQLFIQSQRQVSALFQTGRTISSQVTKCLSAVAAQLIPMRSLQGGTWNLPLAPPVFFRPKQAAPAGPTLGVLGNAASAFVLLDGQLAAAVPPLPAAAEPSPTLLPFLIAADQVEVSTAALLADLSNMAYMAGDGLLTAGHLERTHHLHLVSSSLACMLPDRAGHLHRSSSTVGGSDAMVVAAAAAGVAAAAAAASDAPPPVLLLPVEAAEATAAAACASPVSSPRQRSPRTSSPGSHHNHSAVPHTVSAGGHWSRTHSEAHAALVLTPCDSHLLPHHGADSPHRSVSSTSAVSFVDLSSPSAARSALSGSASPGPAMFLTEDFSSVATHSYASLATFSEEASDSAPHRVSAGVHYLAAANVHVATQLAEAPSAQGVVSHITPAMAAASALLSRPLPASGAAPVTEGSGDSSTSSDASTSSAAVSAAPCAEGRLSDCGVEAEDADMPLCDPSPPTAWFVCDDPTTKIRHFVLQGSTNWEHWQINMQFDPVVFEDASLGVRIHRGVYETACLMYDDLLPLVREHVATSPFAKISFTGHSLGGSLAVVIMLLFVARGELKPQSVSPVYTFGAPAVFCEDPSAGDDEQQLENPQASLDPLSMTSSSYTGGAMAAAGSWSIQQAAAACVSSPDAADSAECGRAGAAMTATKGLLQSLKLRAELIVNVIMHKDIVPRAFVCDYSMVADLLKSWWPSFQDHSTLQPGNHQSLYGFLGRVAVLQPADECAFVVRDGQHEMLPQQPALYKLYEERPAGYRQWDGTARHVHRTASHMAYDEVMGVSAQGSGSNGVLDGRQEAEVTPITLKEALTQFMNTPHPLTILADFKSYGANGTISRYHNPENYARALEALLKRE